MDFEQANYRNYIDLYTIQAAAHYTMTLYRLTNYPQASKNNNRTSKSEMSQYDRRSERCERSYRINDRLERRVIL